MIKDLLLRVADSDGKLFTVAGLRIDTTAPGNQLIPGKPLSLAGNGVFKDTESSEKVHFSFNRFSMRWLIIDPGIGIFSAPFKISKLEPWPEGHDEHGFYVEMTSTKDGEFLSLKSEVTPDQTARHRAILTSRSPLPAALKEIDRLNQRVLELQGHLSGSQAPTCFSCGVSVLDPCPRPQSKTCGRSSGGWWFNPEIANSCPDQSDASVRGLALDKADPSESMPVCQHLRSIRRRFRRSFHPLKDKSTAF